MSPAGGRITYPALRSPLIDEALELDLPPCPHCGALRGDPCRSPLDRITAVHVARRMAP